MAARLWQRRWVWVVTVALAAGAWAVVRAMSSATETLATAEVTRGDYVDVVEVRGEVRPVRSLVVTAPRDAGELTIVSLARNGTDVKKGDVVAVLAERRAKAQMGADRARQNLGTLVLTAPADGVVVVRENRDASGGFFFSGMSLPEWREGDTAFAGRPMFDVFDPGAMEIRAVVNEQEHANLSVVQAAMVELKSATGAPRPATILTLGSIGRGTQGPLRLFDVVLALDTEDESLRPGTTVAIVVKGATLEGVLSIPTHALFEKDGKSHVYVRQAGEFSMTEVRILHRNESRVVIEGVDEGAEIALVDPTRQPGSAR